MIKDYLLIICQIVSCKEGEIRMKKRTIIVLSALVGALVGTVAGAGAVAKVTVGSDEKAKELSEKHLALFLMMNQWVKVKQEGKNLSSYFEKNGYKKIAIYGMSYAGETLLDELKGSGIELAYCIDKNADGIYVDLDVVSVDDSLEDVDAVVVTAITFFDEIKETLVKKLNCEIISLEDILYEI